MVKRRLKLATLSFARYLRSFNYFHIWDRSDEGSIDPRIRLLFRTLIDHPLVVTCIKKQEDSLRGYDQVFYNVNQIVSFYLVILPIYYLFLKCKAKGWVSEAKNRKFIFPIQSKCASSISCTKPKHKKASSFYVPTQSRNLSRIFIYSFNSFKTYPVGFELLESPMPRDPKLSPQHNISAATGSRRKEGVKNASSKTSEQDGK